jgi:uncharacterized protein (TIGR02147 family)
MNDIFAFKDYKTYLNEKLDSLDDGGRGTRARLSRSIGCQTAYTAQVLRGNAHFSLEQVEAINDFLGHTDEQGHYLLLLLQIARAGTPKLKIRFQIQAEILSKGRSQLKNRLEIEAGLEERHQIRYYSSWHYAAIHALVSIPGFQSPEKISNRLNIGLKKTQEALEFLLEAQLIEKNKLGHLKIGKGRIHLGADSPMISKHHSNWRLQAIRATEKSDEENLHYSSVISVSQKDRSLIKELLIECLKTVKPIIRDSKEEGLCSLNLDFFEI